MTDESTPSNPIDAARFAELQEATGAEFVVELVDAFLDDAPSLLIALRDAHSAGDATTFRRTAHSLKTNALTFGATNLGAMARDLEQQSVEAVTADINRLGALADEYARVAAALTAMCHG